MADGDLVVEALMHRKLTLLARAILPRSLRVHLLTMSAVWRSTNSRASKARYFLKVLSGASAVLWFCDWLSRRLLSSLVRPGRLMSEARVRNGRVRTLWGVTPILTLPLKAKADRALGFQSASLVYTTYVMTSRFEINLARYLSAARTVGLALVFQRMVLAYAILRYDVFHTFADRGLLDPKVRLQIRDEELAAWQAAGKRVYVYGYGADVRTRERTLALGRWNFCTDCTEPTKYCICTDAAGERYISEIAEGVTALVSLGDMLAYMPGAKHVNYWPIDTESLSSSPLQASAAPLRIGHAPNHTHFKGSSYLEKAIDRLRLAGHQIEYVKIQGVPNAEVIDLFKNCDLIADQFIGGAYGYTALEAMALGRPVLSYVRTPDLVEAPKECPLLNVTPDLLEEVLTWVLNNRDKLPAIGAQGRSYVLRWHSVDAVASRLGGLYQETAGFPQAVLVNIERQREEEVRRRDSIPAAVGWEHPYRVCSSEVSDLSPTVACGQGA